jgi:hypothetical protein
VPHATILGLVSWTAMMTAAVVRKLITFSPGHFVRVDQGRRYADFIASIACGLVGLDAQQPPDENTAKGITVRLNPDEIEAPRSVPKTSEGHSRPTRERSPERVRQSADNRSPG